MGEIEKVNGEKIIVKEGNIFEEPGKKVIAFNQYFDTTVDDEIIAKGYTVKDSKDGMEVSKK